MLLRFMRAKLWVIGVGLALSGCAALRNECKTHLGSQWHELRTPHFRVQTGLPLAEAREAAQRLEVARRALLVPWSADFDPPSQVDVVLLEDVVSFHEFWLPGVAGFTANRASGTLLVVPARPPQDALGLIPPDTQFIPEVMAHELTHHLLTQAMPRMPEWVSEGMAEYLSTIAVADSGRSVAVGRAPKSRVEAVRKHGVLSLERLWRWEATCWDNERANHCYASAWAWVHYLTNEHADAWAAFQSGLARSESPREAFATAFKGVDATALDAGILAYFRRNQAAIYTHPLPELDAPVEARAMRDAEVHLVRATLRSMGHLRTFRPMGFNEERRHWYPSTPEERLRAVRSEVEQALQFEPDSVDAQVLLAQTRATAEEQRQSLRALVQQHPQAGLAWKALGLSLVEAIYAQQERGEALERAHALLGDDAEVLGALALHRAGTGRAVDGLPLARRALELLPWSPVAMATYASVLHRVGRCPDAVLLQQRALRTLHTGDMQMWASFSQLLRQYETACPEAQAASH